MAVIQLPKFQQPQASIPQIVQPNTGAAEVAKAKFQFQSNIWNGIVSLAQTGIALWKRHEATIAQDEFDTGRLAYAKAMDDAEFQFAQKPILPSSDDPYPTSSALKTVHEAMLKGLNTYSNDRVRGALRNFYEGEFLKRNSAARFGDLKLTKEKTFDDLSENFQYQVKAGNLDEARNIVANMRGMGLVNDVTADSLLDGAYQTVNAEVLIGEALAMGDKKKGAELLSKAESYMSYDKQRLFTPEQKNALYTQYDRKWKDSEAEALQVKEQNWFKAVNDYTVFIDKNRENVSGLVGLRDIVRADKRIDDYKDHTGKKEHYLNLIDSLIEDIRNPKEGKEKDWTPPEVKNDIEKARFDETISNQAFNELLERRKNEISPKLFKELYGKDNARQESVIYSNSFKMINETFDRFVTQNKNLKPEQLAAVEETRGAAVNAFDELIRNPDLVNMKPDTRRKYVEDKANAIVTENNWKNLSTLTENARKPLTREQYSDTIKGTNEAKDFQAKVQAGRMVETTQTRAQVNQHKINLADKMKFFTGSEPSRVVDAQEFAGQNTGEPYFMYKADGAPRTSDRLSPREIRDKGAVPADIGKFYIKDPKTGALSQLYRIRLDDGTKSWQYQIWDGKAKSWTPVDDSFKSTYWPIAEQSYFKRRLPGFVPPAEEPELTVDQLIQQGIAP